MLSPKACFCATENGQGNRMVSDTSVRVKMTKAPQPADEKLMMWQLLRTFIWMDRGLQENLQRRGWPEISRTESQVMLLVSEGIQRPIDMSRALGLTRQAINQTIKLLTKKDLVRMAEDPDDRRCKIVTFVGAHEAIRSDAKHILASLEDELASKIGASAVKGLKQLAKGELGQPPEVIFPK